MRPYSLDTSFLIDVLNGDDRAREVRERLDDTADPLAVTPVAAAEVQVGGNLGTAAELRGVEKLLDGLIWLDITREAARRASQIQADLKRDGTPIPFTDCLIAGTTLVHGGVLVTRDADFERLSDLAVETY